MLETILVTGGTGFLGSYLVRSLLKNGFNVIVLKRSTSNTWRISDVLADMKCYDIDVCRMEAAFREQHIDVVIHTACCYGRKGEPPGVIVETNLMLGLKLFELCATFNTGTFINTGTLRQKYLNAYTLSKKQMVEWLKQGAGKTRVINMKLEHLYGPKDDASKFVPWVIEQFEQNKTEIKLTSGIQERDFVYVTDAAAAYQHILLLRRSLGTFTEFDVGTGEAVKVRDFVSALAAAYKERHPENKTELLFGAVPYHDGEMMKVSANVDAMRELGWKAAVKYQSGIKKILSSEAA